MTKRRIVLGISGASGFQYGYKALQLLQDIENVETHLVISKGAEMARALETPYTKEEVCKMADIVHPIGNLAASISSGSFKTVGMLVAPCSMRTLAAVAHGYSDNLLTRAADVVLKRTPPPGADGAGNTAESGAFGQYAPRNRNGRHHLPTCARTISPTTKTSMTS